MHENRNVGVIVYAAREWLVSRFPCINEIDSSPVALGFFLCANMKFKYEIGDYFLNDSLYMKSLKRKYDDHQKKHRFASSIASFNMACMDGKFSRDRIGRHFKKLVDPEDYDGSNKREVLAYAYALSNPVNRTPKAPILPAGDERKDRDDDMDV